MQTIQETSPSRKIVENTNEAVPAAMTDLEKLRRGVVEAKDFAPPNFNHNKILIDNGFYRKALSEAKWEVVSKEFLADLKNLYKDGMLNKMSFYIHSVNGTGKTYLLHLLAKKLIIKLNMYPQYIRYTRLLELFIKEDEPYQLRNIHNSDALFIDEFGKGKDNDFYLSKIEDLFEYRIMNYKPMYIAGNYDDSELAKRGLYSIADRLNDSKTFFKIEYGTQSKRN